MDEPKDRSQDDTIHNNKVRLECLYVSLICAFLTLVAIIFETIALLNVQYCDGEDLANLYWAAWTLLQAGSLIAILGISLSQWCFLAGKEQPKWNYALGTPVLVVAGFGHEMAEIIWRLWQESRGNGGDDTSAMATTVEKKYVSFCTE